MTIELSCGLPPGPDFSDLAVLAESLGYSRVWVFDSAPLWEDPFVHLALAAERTSRIGLGTAVLIPDERSEMAMTSAIATIARLSGGRYRACFGTGATARRGQPARMLMPATVLDPGEDRDSARVRDAVGPWKVVSYHEAYAIVGPDVVDGLPGGRAWREALEELAPA